MHRVQRFENRASSLCTRLIVCLGVALVCSCSHAATPSNNPTQPHVALLLDVGSESEAYAVAVVKQGEWLLPAVAGEELLKEITRPGTSYVLLPSISSEPPTQGGQGQLSGGWREDCREYFFGLAKPAVSLAFGVVNPVSPAQSVSVERVEVAPEHVAVVAQILERLGGIRVIPSIEHVFRADLDGDKKPELILQATHPELAGDPPEYKPEFYSLLVVLSEGSAAEPAVWGYLEASKDLRGFRVVSLDAVADVDRDGRHELLVRVRHAEGWQTRAFHYQSDSGLVQVFNSVGGERDCPQPAD